MRWTAASAVVVGALIVARLAETTPEAVSFRTDEPAWDAFLDTLQERTLRFFLETTDTATGLTPDRAPSPSASSIAAVGFALTSYAIAAERSMIAREEAAMRVLNTLRYLTHLPQNNSSRGSSGYRGFFYHFLNMEDGTRARQSELSTIDTALLLAGILLSQSYFDSNSSEEQLIRSLADTLYRQVDWQWAMGGKPGLALAWAPETGFSPHIWRGYNEAMILYILALGSPTHPVPEGVWNVWTESYVWAEYHDSKFISFGPLFGHQYSHCWIDFRGIQDSYMREKGIDYFENSRRATYSQRQYGRDNPQGWRDYSDSIWGWTACDGPGDATLIIDGRIRTFWAYKARGVSFDWVGDDGTIAPTAAGGSIPFAPEICIPALKAMRRKYGTRLWKEYGFVDAFNPTFATEVIGSGGWFDPDYIGIDQGPIATMIENYRNEFVWNVMKKNPHIVRGLKRAGFRGGWLEVDVQKE